MPVRGKLLSDYEQGRISALHEEGVTVADIARRLERSYNCINKFLMRDGPYVKGGGRPAILDDRIKRRIAREMLQNPSPSLRQLVQSLGLSCSPQTVLSFLVDEGFRYVPMLKAPLLLDRHKQTRKIWAKKMLCDLALNKLDLRNITFSDEKRFLLDGPDGCRYYWAKAGDIRNFFGKKVFSRGLIVWGGIGYGGTTAICIKEQNINAEVYRDILHSSYLRFHQPGFILMQDNATPHVANSTLQFLEEEGVRVLDWPACSPDCNPIENIWGIMVKRLYIQGTAYNSIEDLKKAIEDCWNSISIEEVRNLVE